MTTETAAPPKNVLEAIAAVMRDLPGIGKDSSASEGQGNYKYRGIEAITAEIQKLLGLHGVVLVPHETGFLVEPIIVNGKPWTDTIITIEYDVFGPGGVEDHLPERLGPIHAIGRDNSDKGANKARTQAFKYALLHLFSIGDSKDDGDNGSTEADSRGAAPPPEPGSATDPTRLVRAEQADRIRKLNEEQRAAVIGFCDKAEITRVAKDWTDEQLEKVKSFIDELPAQEPSEPEAPPTGASKATDAETGGASDEVAPPVSPPKAKAEPDKDSFLAGIKQYEERLDETTFPIYTEWLADTFGDESTDITKLDAAALEEIWHKLDELTKEGAPA